jgi:CHASE3 domain sensor protein
MVEARTVEREPSWPSAPGYGPEWTGATQGEVSMPEASRWSLRRRMGAMLAVLGLLLALDAVLVVQTEGMVSQAHLNAIKAKEEGMEVLRAQVGMQKQQAALANFLSSKDSGYLDDYNQAGTEVTQALKQLAGSGLDSEGKFDLSQVQRYVDSWHSWADERKASVNQKLAPGAEVADARIGQLQFDNLYRATLTFQQYSNGRTAAAEAAALAASSFQAKAVLVAAGLGLAILALLAVLFFRSTLRPLTDLVKVSVDLASGRQVSIPWTRRRDEVGQLAVALAAWNRSARERLALTRAMAEVSNHENIDDMLALTAQTIQEQLSAAQVVVVLGLKSEWRVVRSLPVPYVSELLVGRSPEADALRTGRVVLADLRSGEWDVSLRAWQAVNDFAWVMSVPLMSGGQLLGVVSAVRTVNQPPFSPLDSELSDIVVPPIATAMHVGLLTRELKQFKPAATPDSEARTTFLVTPA